jgi:HAD superfamily hydrolase (TIGR01509 family)
MEGFLSSALAMNWIAYTDVVPDFSRAVEERAGAYPEFAEHLRLFDTRWFETLDGPIEENVALLRRLRASGRRVHALSNFAAEKFALARAHFDFLDAFDVPVISGHVGFAKPDPRIYEILFERAGAKPGELLFVDDSLANIHAAEALGMATIHFRDGVDLEAELRARGALVD